MDNRDPMSNVKVQNSEKQKLKSIILSILALDIDLSFEL
jgi:hypothetical protein